MDFNYPDHEEPEELAEIRVRMTAQDRVRAFVEVFGREPQDEDELDVFIEQYTLELYNNEMDEDPNFDPSP